MTRAESLCDRGRRVLVAEDDSDIRELVSRKLTGAGFEVIAVADGLSALRAAQDEHPDAAVFDVTMPGMSGLAVISVLRAESATADLPVILLTAHSEEFDVSAGMSLGAADYLVKPFSPRELLSRVEAVMTGRTPHRAASS